MTDTQLLITAVLLLTAIAGTLALVVKRLRLDRLAARRMAALHDLLGRAQEQNQLFDISVDGAIRRSPMSGLLAGFSATALQMEILAFVPGELRGEPVEVYFRVNAPEGPAFYRFRSAIAQVRSGNAISRVSLAFPTDIFLGQKRRFFRVQPPKEKVRLIGVWNLPAEKALPRDTAEIGPPLLHYKFGDGAETMQVADISTSGMALSFPLPDPEKRPVDLKLGDRVLCLLVYQVAKENRIVTFWCTCTVSNERTPQEPEPMLIFGLRFTNWAVLERGNSEIRWFNSTEENGASPITQWVRQLEVERRGHP